MMNSEKMETELGTIIVKLVDPEKMKAGPGTLTGAKVAAMVNFATRSPRYHVPLDLLLLVKRCTTLY